MASRSFAFASQGPERVGRTPLVVVVEEVPEDRDRAVWSDECWPEPVASVAFATFPTLFLAKPQALACRMFVFVVVVVVVAVAVAVAVAVVVVLLLL